MGLLNKWLKVSYHARAYEISIRNEREYVTDYFYWKVQQGKLAPHLHRFARGKREEVGGTNVRKRRWLAVWSWMNRAGPLRDILPGRDPSREVRTRKRRHGIPHCSDPVTSSEPPTTTSILPIQMLSKRVVSIARGRAVLTPQPFSRGL